MYIILLFLSCLGIIMTIAGFCLNSEAMLAIGCILISPSYIFILLCIFGVITFPESPNGD